jgi:hypothetical protein
MVGNWKIVAFSLLCALSVRAQDAAPDSLRADSLQSARGDSTVWSGGIALPLTYDLASGVGFMTLNFDAQREIMFADGRPSVFDGHFFRLEAGHPEFRWKTEDCGGWEQSKERAFGLAYFRYWQRFPFSQKRSPFGIGLGVGGSFLVVEHAHWGNRLHKGVYLIPGPLFLTTVTRFMRAAVDLGPLVSLKSLKDSRGFSVRLTILFGLFHRKPEPAKLQKITPPVEHNGTTNNGG